MKKIHIVNSSRLYRVLRTITHEFIRFGIWNERLSGVPVNLSLFSPYYGWQAYGTTGAIHIPIFSLCRLRDWCSGAYVSLADVVRHEYAHAIAHCYPSLVRSRAFVQAFTASHDAEVTVEFIDGFHMTEYAATSPSEDFAETFMLFMRTKGKLPRCYQTPLIRKKWRFIRRLCRAIHSGSRTV